MENPRLGRGEGADEYSREAAKTTLADLASCPDAPECHRLLELLNLKPETHRERLAQNYVRLALAMLDAGLKDPRPAVTRKPSYLARLRTGLMAGTFKPPNAAALLADLHRAQAGDHEAKERVVSYLRQPGVGEALDDG